MKNDTKLKQLGLGKEVRFYHARAETDSRLVAHRVRAMTVCLIRISSDLYVRGISVCSLQDHFIKKSGREIALGRAIQAMERKRSIKVRITDSNVTVLGYGVELTDFERNLYKERIKPEHLSQEEVESLTAKAVMPK